jgi:hypothetical protein
MFKQILVVGMLLLSGVASAQQARGEFKLDVSLSCFPIKTMVETVKALRYEPVLTAQGNEAKTLFYSVWVGPQGQMLVLGSTQNTTCIMAEGAELKSVVDGE